MVKILGAAMTGFACAYFGFRMSTALRTRLRSLGDIADSLELLEGEILFSANRLKKALLQTGKSSIFTLAAEKMESANAEGAWTEAVNEQKAKLCLTEADSKTLLMLGKSIGKTDAENQIKNIRYVKTLIAAQKEQAAEEYSRYGRLYRNGGILVGLMAVIILI